MSIEEPYHATKTRCLILIYVTVAGLSTFFKCLFFLQAEEAKLISQLAEMDIVNDQLFKQAYEASLDVSKFLDRYEMSKHLRGPFDKEGVCLIITAGPEGITSEV